MRVIKSLLISILLFFTIVYGKEQSTTLTDSQKQERIKKIIPIITTLLLDDNNQQNELSPKIVLKGSNPQIIEYGNNYVELGATVSDNKDKNIKLNIDTSNLNINKLGVYKVIYSATNSLGYTTKVKRVVKVVDTTPPTITLKGDNPLTLEINTTYQEPGFSANDNYDKDITNRVTIINNIDTTNVGYYNIIYKVSDSSGNEVEEIRVVKVKDSKAPTITLKGDNPQIIEYGNSYIELGATVSDNQDSNVTLNIDTSNLNINKLGVYEVIYIATNTQGHKI